MFPILLQVEICCHDGLIDMIAIGFEGLLQTGQGSLQDGAAFSSQSRARLVTNGESIRFR